MNQRKRLGKIRIRRIIINDYVIGICHKLAARYKQLKKDLDDAEKFVRKEIEDIEREMK